MFTNRQATQISPVSVLSSAGAPQWSPEASKEAFALALSTTLPETPSSIQATLDRFNAHMLRAEEHMLRAEEHMLRVDQHMLRMGEHVEHVNKYISHVSKEKSKVRDVVYYHHERKIALVLILL